MVTHQHLPENYRGRDFFVGDIHGNLRQLERQLYELEFDSDRDRLFCTGDLVDRGEDSLQTLMLAKQPWLQAVSGNHEDMLIDFLISDQQARSFTQALLIANGGKWATQLSADEEQECLQIMQSLPLAITVPYQGKTIGIIHAGWAWHWAELQTGISSDQREFALWARLDDPLLKDSVTGIDIVVSGHQNTDNIITRGNQVWIDTAGQTGRLTILKADEIIRCFR